MVARAEDYPWSSAAARCARRNDPVLADGIPLTEAIEDWQAWLREPFANEGAHFDAICQQTHTGRPCGAPSFVEDLEQATGRPCAPNPAAPGGERNTKSEKFRSLSL